MRELAMGFTKSASGETSLEYALIAAGISVGVMMGRCHRHKRMALLNFEQQRDG